MIDPSSPRTNDSLTVVTSSTDPDGDTVSYDYQWIKNSSDLASETGAQSRPLRPRQLRRRPPWLQLADAPKSLSDMANRTSMHWASVLLTYDWPCNQLHALCYGLEGMLIADTGNGDLLDQAALAFARLMELQSPDGTLPETVEGGVVRSDVLAQALRIGLLLRGRGYLVGPDWADRLDALAHALMGFVRVDGGVLFAREQVIANTWCAMFAHQALYLHARRHLCDPAPAAAFAYLV